MLFNEWWEKIGSGIAKLDAEDNEEHAHRVAKAAWEFAIPAEEVTVTVEDLLDAADAEKLESMLIECAEDRGYFGSLDVSFDYWHYGRHAEFARELGLPDLARLFSAAWQIESRVLRENDPEAREEAQEQIRAEFPNL